MIDDPLADHPVEFVERLAGHPSELVVTRLLGVVQHEGADLAFDDERRADARYDLIEFGFRHGGSCVVVVVV